MHSRRFLAFPIIAMCILVVGVYLSSGLLATTYASIGLIALQQTLLGASLDSIEGETGLLAADAWLERAAALGNYRAYAGLARVAMAHEDYRAAERLFVQALTKHPEDQVSHFFLAQAYKAMGNQEAALAQWREAGAAPLFLDQGFKALCRGEMLKALANYEIGAALEPTAENLIALGKLYRQTGSADQALMALEQAMGIDPERPDAYMLIASLYLQQGDLSRARSFYEHALQRDSQFAEAYTGLGRVVYAQSGDLGMCQAF